MSHFPAETLIQWINERELVKAVRECRALRKQGFRGAVLYELLALVAFRRPQELTMARKLVPEIQASDLYTSSTVEIPMDPDQVITACSWVLHHEWKSSAPGFHHGVRVQQLIFEYQRIGGQSFEAISIDSIISQFTQLKDGIDSLVTQAALISERFLELNDFRNAFQMISFASRLKADDSMVRRAGLKLIRSVPSELRIEVLQYDRRGGMHAFTIAPIENCGYLASEYRGACIDSSDLLRLEVPQLPSLCVLNQVETSNEALSLQEMQKRKDQIIKKMIPILMEQKSGTKESSLDNRARTSTKNNN